LKTFILWDGQIVKLIPFGFLNREIPEMYMCEVALIGFVQTLFFSLFLSTKREKETKDYDHI